MDRIRLRYSKDALEIFKGAEFNFETAAVLLLLGALASAMVALAWDAMTPALWVLLAGIVAAMAATALYAATRSLRVVVRKGEVSWTRSVLGRSWETRTVPEAEFGNVTAKASAWIGLRAARFALRLGQARGRPQIDGFRWKTDAEALGKLIEAEMRSGPSSRAAVHRDPDIAEFLGRGNPA